MKRKQGNVKLTRWSLRWCSSAPDWFSMRWQSLRSSWLRWLFQVMDSCLFGLRLAMLRDGRWAVLRWGMLRWRWHLLHLLQLLLLGGTQREREIPRLLCISTSSEISVIIEAGKINTFKSAQNHEAPLSLQALLFCPKMWGQGGGGLPGSGSNKEDQQHLMTCRPFAGSNKTEELGERQG